jgi:hypothetical protein
MEVSIIHKVGITIIGMISIVIINSKTNPTVPINKSIRNGSIIITWIRIFHPMGRIIPVRHVEIPSKSKP